MFGDTGVERGDGTARAADRYTFGKILRTVVTVEISHHPDPRNNLAFHRGFPTVGVGAVDRWGVGVVEGITEEDVAAGGNLSAGQTSKQKQNENAESNLSHTTYPYLSYEIRSQS